MLFSEIYGSYYNTVGKIISEAVKGSLTDKKMFEIITRNAFSESSVSIPQHLKDTSWPLLTENNKTVLKSSPAAPLSCLQKSWLKSILLDPRIKLFSPEIKGLENVKPLYNPEDIVYFDKYTDGDSFSDPEYINNFQTALRAFRSGKALKIEYIDRREKTISLKCFVKNLEYSLKDDKFRVNAFYQGESFTLNMNRIKSCEELEDELSENQRISQRAKKEVVLQLTDERNSLERAMIHFSHLEKEARQTEQNRYTIKLKYYQEDEAEMLIRVLSFGPMIKVISPEDFAEKIKSRLFAQKALTTPEEFSKKGKYIYVGCFVNKQELNVLTKNIRKNPLPQAIENPHITFQYKPSTVDEGLFGAKIQVKVTGYCNNGTNEGLLVELFSHNKEISDMINRIKTPHITLSLSDNGKAVDTRLLKFSPITPFFIEGVFEGVHY